MAKYEHFRKHAELLDRMAEARGLDLQEVALNGDIAPGTISDALLACAGCVNPDGCRHWLNAQEGVAQKSPSQCENAELFDSLLTR